MCVLYVSFGSKVRLRTFGCVAMGSALLSIFRSRHYCIYCRVWHEEVITLTDLTHNSRRAWQTIRKLSNDPTTPNPPCLVNANHVAHQLLINGQGPMPTKPKWPKLPPIKEGTPTMVHLFSEEEYRKGIVALKNNKAAGRDDVLVEELKHLGPKANKWLHTKLNVCFTGNKIPKIWTQSKINAILKPGKKTAIPKNYRPMSLLCHTYKLYERMILNRTACHREVSCSPSLSTSTLTTSLSTTEHVASYTHTI